MQTTYGRGHGGTGRGGKQPKKGGGSRQLVQLLVCLAVFLAVFIGKGIWPSEMARTGGEVLQLIQSNTDFKAAFAGLGQALSDEDSVLGELGSFCAAVFAPLEGEDDTAAVQAAAPQEHAVSTEPVSLSSEEQETQPALEPEPSEPEKPALRVGDVVQEVAAVQELPEGYSGQWLWLGELETAVPVHGAITSGFGYRDHPTIGRYAPHGGVDIAAETGTAVAAFADGTVERVGEDGDFGKYVYLSHSNGVTTFYAHCSKITAGQGERVRAGQTVALVGSTGKSTGPHLHFEVRLNGTRLDPTHYLAAE